MNNGLFSRLTRQTTITYIAFALLGIVTIYCAWYANYFLSGNSDDIVYPYLFRHFQLHDILLPGQHSNILKFPLFILLALIPYTFTTFTITNIGLVLIAVLGWAALLIWVFGKRYSPIICLTLASVLLGSQLLNYDLLGMTIRNIEYPIVLAFIICSGLLLRRQRLSRKKLFIVGISGVLYALTVSGDSFFLYTTSISLLGSMLFFWFNANKETVKRYTFYIPTTYIAGFILLALIIREAVKVLGIARYYTASVFSPQILPVSHLGPSISTATLQVLSLFDANIFGQQITPTSTLVFLNFILLIIGLVGLVYILFDTCSTHRRKELLTRMSFAQIFTLTVLALSSFVTYILYILSGLVVNPTASGGFVSAGQDRYLSMLPLLLVVGIAYLVRRNFETRKIVNIGIPVLIVVVILLNLGSIKQAHVYDSSQRSSAIAIAKVLTAKHVPLVVTGYWYGASIRFWSGDKVMFASVDGCNISDPNFNTRISWYNPNPAIHLSALVTSRQGVDASYSNCSNQQLTNIYGPPEQIINVNTPDQPTIWLYNYDIRSKLSPISY
jgi:hypothetical protein